MRLDFVSCLNKNRRKTIARLSPVPIFYKVKIHFLPQAVALCATAATTTSEQSLTIDGHGVQVALNESLYGLLHVFNHCFHHVILSFFSLILRGFFGPSLSLP